MGFHILLCCVFLGLSALVESQQQTLPPPVRLAPSISQSNSLTCPLLNFSALREMARQGIEDYYQFNSTSSTNNPSPCSCGGDGWTRAVYLNMSDRNQQCPDNLTLITTPVRGCGRTNRGYGVCDSVLYEVNGRTYSQVCGRILAYQQGVPAAFHSSVVGSFNTIEDAYLSGVSLTHGAPGSRQHIWSFTAAVLEKDGGIFPAEKCPCSIINYPYQVPTFMNNDYFCESGNPGPSYSLSAYYIDDPLWDGHGCGTNSTCCEFNNPPWFCTSLPQPTDDDLEIRHCVTNSHSEDSIISLIDINVK